MFATKHVTVIALMLMLPLCSGFHAIPRHVLGLRAVSASNKQCISFPTKTVTSHRILDYGAGGSGRGGIRGSGGGGGGGGGSGMGDESSGWGPLQLWSRYISLLDTAPLKTRMATGFVISALGDVISQAIAGLDFKDLDLKRLLVFSLWGSVCFTPMGYKWYGFIEQTIPKNIPARSVAKMLMDQAVFPPLMTTITFMCLTVAEGLLAGIGLNAAKGLHCTGVKAKSLGDLVSDGCIKVKKELGPTLVENYKVWPAAQVLNFAVVPLKFQVLFVNCVAVWWNFVISATQHK